jgi:hypothetical protein
MRNGVRHWFYTFQIPGEEKNFFGAIRMPAIPGLSFSKVRDSFIIPYLKSIGITSTTRLTYARAKNAPIQTEIIDAYTISPTVTFKGISYDTKARTIIRAVDVIKKNYEIFETFILDELTHIDSMFDIYIYLYNLTTKDDTLNALNIAPGFFGLSILSFRDTAVIRLSKLCENNKYSTNTLNVSKYLDIIEQNASVIFGNESFEQVKNTIAKHRIELEGQKERIEKVNTIRDKCLAHNEIKFIRDDKDPWIISKIIIEDIHLLTKWISNVVNDYRAIRGQYPAALGAIGKDDVKKVINAIMEVQSKQI